MGPLILFNLFTLKVLGLYILPPPNITNENLNLEPTELLVVSPPPAHNSFSSFLIFTMTGKGNRFYVVFRGRNPGIYFSWEDCNAQVYKFRDNKHECYSTLEMAQAAFQNYFQQQEVRESPILHEEVHTQCSHEVFPGCSSGNTPNLSQSSSSSSTPVQQGFMFS